MRISKKAFTLVEMLIVIVIIGILAAALIPRLLSVQSRARDTKRKADLSQIGSAVAIYRADNNSFPATSGNTDTVLKPLVSGYMSAMPTEPLSNVASTFSVELAVANTVTFSVNSGYIYISVLRNWISSNGIVLAADTETDGSSSNYPATGLTYATDLNALESSISGCGGRLLKGAYSWTGGICAAPATGYRYYYTQ